MKWLLFVSVFLISCLSFCEDNATTVVQAPVPDHDSGRFGTDPRFFDVSGDGRFVLTGNMYELRIYDLDSRCLMTHLRKPLPVMFGGAALSPDGRHLVFHKTVPPNYPVAPVLLDIATGQELDLELGVSFPVGEWHITVTEDEAVFNPVAGGSRTVRPIKNHAESLLSGIPGRDGSTIVWRGGDTLERLDRNSTKSEVNLIANPDLRFTPLPGIAVTIEGHPLVAAQDRDKVRIIDVMDDSLIGEFVGTRPILDVEGRRIALLEPDGRVAVFEIAGGRKLGVYGTKQENPLYTLSGDGERLALWSREQKAVLDIPLDGGNTQSFLRNWENEYDDPAYLAYSRNGGFLAISSSGVTLEDLLFVNTGTRKIVSVKEGAQPVFDRTGRFLAFSYFSGKGSARVGVIDTANNQLIAESPMFDIGGYMPDSLDFTADSRGLLIPNGSNGMLQYDFLDDAGKEPGAVCRGDFQAGVFVESDSRLWSYTSRGELVLVDSDAKKVLLKVFPFSNGRIVAIRPNNQYMGAPDTLDAVAFKKGRQAWPVEQFDLLMNRPHEILSVLGAPEERVKILKNAFERRLRREGLNEGAIQFDLPVLRIENREKIPRNTTRERVNIEYSAEVGGAALSKIILQINDVPMVESDIFKGAVDAVMSPGSNKIQLSVVDNAGAESLRQTIYVSHESDSSRSPDLWIVAVGVSEYTELPSLEVAAKDAEDLVALFKKREGSTFTNVHKKVLLNESATRENILAARDFLQQSKVGDQIIVFVAGHGLHDSNYDYWFGTPDIEADNPSERGLSYGELEGLFLNAPARKRLLLMDTCFAGEVDREDVALATEGQKLPKGVRARVVSRNGVSTENLKASETSNALKSMFADFRRRTGATVFTASSGVEFVFALEAEELGNGVFTHAFMEGIESGEADLDGDGIVKASEWQRFGFDRVVNLTGGQQRPTSRQINREMDYEIARTGVVATTEQGATMNAERIPEEWQITEQVNSSNGGWRIEWNCTLRKKGNLFTGSGNKIRVNGKAASSGERKTTLRLNGSLTGRAMVGTSEEVNASGGKIPGRFAIEFSSDFQFFKGKLLDKEGNHISDLDGQAQ